MPCLAQDYHPKLPATNHYCKSLSSLVRETYAHCHVPCLRIPAARWSSGEDDTDDDDDDDALDTKQVILNEMRNREMKKQRSRCSVVSSPTLSSAFIWSFTPLDPRSVLIDKASNEKCVVVNEVEGIEKKRLDEMEAAGDDGDGGNDGDDESEAFFSVKSFFTRSTSRAATVASSDDMNPRSPATWEGFRDCEGWPFGLCRRPTVPPLPNTPADSWKWRKRSSSSSLAARPGQNPAPAYSYKIASTNLPRSPLAVHDSIHGSRHC